MSAGPTLFNRFCQTQIDTVQVSQLRTTFEISRSLSKEPNKCAVAVYNLAADTRAKMKKQDVFVSIDAGYKDIHSVIFQGWVRTIEHVRDGTEWISRTRGGDGEKPIRTARISQSWKAGTSIAVVLDALANATGIATGNVPSVAAAGKFRKNVSTFSRGFVAQGSAYDKLAQVAYSLGYDLSVQDGALMMVEFGGAVVKAAVKLSPSTGLHGSPEAGEKGIIRAISSLSGSFFPGRQVQLESDRYKGLYRVYRMAHKGDTHGTNDGSWVSILDLQPLSGTPTTRAP